MALFSKIQQRLKNFDFAGLFTQELLWNNFSGHGLDIPVDGNHYLLAPVAEQSGLAVYLCTPATAAEFPDYPTRRTIDNRVTKFVREHIVIYQDPAKKYQVWQWVKREAGKASACREQRFEVHQTGDALIQKLLQIKFALEDEPTIGEAREKVKKAFDLEKVTKKFYDEFKSQHAAFLKFLKGIPDEHLQRWYASVMLNRLMFIYFIQKKGFLGGDLNYLKNRLIASKKNGKNEFYSEFLCPLFFEGFAKRESDRSAKTKSLLGNIPYLNGGLFLKHQIEQAHGKTIEIPDLAFEKIFVFFDQYQWQLDDRPTRDGNEINPDVLGYVFEKYINQKEMGAYYTKEDITGYISQNTIIPAVFDIARKGCKIAFEGEHSIWNLLKEDPDRYFYAAVLHGTGEALPKEIAAGVKDVAKRGEWNKTAPEEYGLPTETWREVVARRQRYEEVREKLASGEVQSINDLITYNLDVERFAEEVISNSEGSDLVWAFYKAVEKLSVLDPTCGSGAFLFAALNILEKLYDTCLVRMQAFVVDLDQSGEKHSPKKFEHFRLILTEMNDKSKHPSPRYFILKSIILNNIYGVDIMEEATEICKLRLFLKLVAQVNAGERIEPLPDIDFNIRAGNTLVGFASQQQLGRALGRLGHQEKKNDIEERAKDVGRAYQRFRDQQVVGETGSSGDASKCKADLQGRLEKLRDELDDYLAGEYNIRGNDRVALSKWRQNYEPLHWIVEFYGIMTGGGFDVIIGNPPYVEFSKKDPKTKKSVKDQYQIRDYVTEPCDDLFAFTLERSIRLASSTSRLGFIVPLSAFSVVSFKSLQDHCRAAASQLWVSSWSGDAHPSKLFEGVDKRLQITLLRRGENKDNEAYSSKYLKWYASERPNLFARWPAFSRHRSPGIPVGSTLPKCGNEKEWEIFRKLGVQSSSVGLLSTDMVTAFPVYYTRKVSFFLQFLDFVPEVRDPKGKLREPSELKVLYFGDAKSRDVALAGLSSSLFYWYNTVISDCRNLNKREVVSFPIPEMLASKGDKELKDILSRLMKDYRANSSHRTVKYEKTGEITVQYFNFRPSKPIIDEIDRLFARYFGLTPDEIDCIVNYDIKYRLGKDHDQGQGVEEQDGEEVLAPK